jgi:hypothetical protein
MQQTQLERTQHLTQDGNCGFLIIPSEQFGAPSRRPDLSSLHGVDVLLYLRPRSRTMASAPEVPGQHCQRALPHPFAFGSSKGADIDSASFLFPLRPRNHSSLHPSHSILNFPYSLQITYLNDSGVLSWSVFACTEPRSVCVKTSKPSCSGVIEKSPNSFPCHTSRNSPVSPIIATLPKTCVSNLRVCHTSETPRGADHILLTPDPASQRPYICYSESLQTLRRSFTLREPEGRSLDHCERIPSS